MDLSEATLALEKTSHRNSHLSEATLSETPKPRLQEYPPPARYGTLSIFKKGYFY